jgi:hypothetical protein
MVREPKAPLATLVCPMPWVKVFIPNPAIPPPLCAPPFWARTDVAATKTVAITSNGSGSERIFIALSLPSSSVRDNEIA